jgi:hypothetical protein
MVKSKNPKTLEETVQIALAEKNNLTQHNTNINNFDKEKDRTKNRSAQYYNKGTCHTCGKYRHYARDFRSKKDKNTDSKNTNKPIVRTFVICALYSKNGHTEAQCSDLSLHSTHKII